MTEGYSSRNFAALRVAPDGRGGDRRCAITASSKAIVWRAENLAFDRKVATSSIGEYNLGFPGQYYDAEGASWQNWFRTYDGSVGRYTQSDPIGLDGGLNTYAYVGGNPLSNTDSEGLLAWGIVFGGADLAWQLSQNGVNLRCVNWGEVGLSMLGGGLLNAFGKGAFAFRTTGSHTWGATRSWMNRRGIQSPGAGQQRHHWLFEQNQGIGKNVPDAIKNQPYNTNPISAELNNSLSRHPALAWMGGPSWAGEVAAGGALAVGGGDDCACQR